MISSLISVNYFITRTCNYKCGFCFHTAKNSFNLALNDSQRGLKMLRDSGMKKINFAGGEPFILEQGRYLGELVRYCKQDLGLESVSIISNGSKVTEEWMQTYGDHLDILGISCDSFNEETNKKIGRYSPSSNHLSKLKQIRDWCLQYSVAFKVNTVVNSYNWEEDMNNDILNLNPARWKVFQCLMLEGENFGPKARRNVLEFLISNEQFQQFVQRHSSVPQMVPESNEIMRDSYLLLDEKLRFLDCSSGKKIPSESILDVGVEKALLDSGFNKEVFEKRGGIFEWSKDKILKKDLLQ